MALLGTVRRRRAAAPPGGSALAAGAGSPAAFVVVLLALLAALAAAAPAELDAQVFMTQDQALALAFPAPLRTERRTAFLTDAELERARQLAGRDVEIRSGVVSYYVGFRGAEPVGVAYFDAHRVRTKAEVAMLVVNRRGTIDRVDILKFTEPPDYLAPDGWIDQLEGKPLDDDLSLKGDVVNLTGATLTARALTRAARRTLALHAVIDPLERERRKVAGQ